MNTIFKVGMPVWDRVRFPNIQGVVDNILPEDVYPIKTSFGERSPSYSLDGRMYNDDLPTLSVVDYEFALPPQIIPHYFKKYDLVLVRNSEQDTWKLSVFGKLEAVGDFVYVTVYGNHWKYCIPFDQETYESQ